MEQERAGKKKVGRGEGAVGERMKVSISSRIDGLLAKGSQRESKGEIRERPHTKKKVLFFFLAFRGGICITQRERDEDVEFFYDLYFMWSPTPSSRFSPARGCLFVCLFALIRN